MIKKDYSIIVCDFGRGEDVDVFYRWVVFGFIKTAFKRVEITFLDKESAELWIAQTM